MHHVMPPAAFQRKNTRHGMCTMPAIQAPKMRRPKIQRATKTVLPPCFAKNVSPQASELSMLPTCASFMTTRRPP